jgi:hypothetical protein
LTIFSLMALSLTGWGFSLLGPSLNSDSYQTESLGYNLGPYDVGAPKSLGQGYRRNAGVVYYGFDQEFYGFFGPDGISAVESAFAVMNALTNADSIQLSQYPFNSQQSFDARALDLSDLKSWTLGELMEQMGLAQSVRFDWTLHDEYLPSGAVCSANPAVNGEEYLVVQRNIDPVSQVYTAYVNNTLYSYQLLESCGKVGVPPDVITGIGVDALANPYPVDVNAQTYTPVSEANDVWANFLQPISFKVNSFIDNFALQDGNYYTGLTYDDVGGLRYLLSTNNINFENPTPGSALEVTNSQLQLLQTSDLAALLEFSKTNPPAAVLAAFPGIVIDNYATYYTVVTNPIIVAYLTNSPGSPASYPPVLYVHTNGYTYTAVTNYVYIFDNVVIVDEYTNTHAQVMTVNLGVQNGSPAGGGLIYTTNVTFKNVVLTNVISGDYYLLPSSSCGYNFYKTILKNDRAGVTTNIIASATNLTTGFVAYESIVTYFTNNWYEYFACNYETSGPALYQGVGKVQFVEMDYDGIIGQVTAPATNFYTMVMMTNGQPVVQRFRRIATQPDILLDAADLASPNVSQIGVGFPPFFRTMTYQEDPQVPGSAPASGPGTITDYPTTISYNDVGPVYFVLGSEVNSQNPFLSTAPSIFLWASYDNSTNAPIIYPYGSLSNLESELVVQISPPVLPFATNTVPYSQTFTASGGGFQPSFKWSLGIDPTTLQQTMLPAGLTLSSGGTISGTPTGNPIGTYDFIIELTDSLGRTVQWNYSIYVDQ